MINPSVVIVSTALSLGAAWFYLSPSRRQGPRGTIDLVMAGVACLHTLLILWTLALHRPPNLFTRLGIPINAPVDRIRSLLMREAGLNAAGGLGAVVVPRQVPKDVETLLARLGVHGSRELYARFGHRALQTCLYCSSPADYALLVLSGVLLEYLRTATLLLLLTTRAHGRHRWRTHVLCALACAFFAEVYAFTSASATPLDNDVRRAFMWHDNLYWARNVVLLTLPLLVQAVPAVYAPPPASVALVPVLGRLERTLARAQLLRYFRQAVMRHPYSRARAVRYWANDAAEGAAGRNDPDVQMTALKLGFGFAPPTGSGERPGQESVLRSNARMAIQSLKSLFAPPEN